MSSQSQVTDIDRAKVCPFLLRCFWNVNHHNNEKDYNNTQNDVYPKNEVQIYTWKDATFREISDLIKDVVPSSRHNQAILEINVVYLTNIGQNRMQKVATVSKGHGPDDDKSLQSVRMVIGDHFDINIMLPKRL